MNLSSSAGFIARQGTGRLLDDKSEKVRIPDADFKHSMSAVRLYVLLFVCLAIVSAVVHKIPTQHHALSGQHSKHLFGFARHQQLYRRKVGMQAGEGKVPTQVVNYLITGAITVGTPPQSFNVEVDAFSYFANDLILIGANADLSSVKENLPKRSTYNADNSSTYVAVSGNISAWFIKSHKAQDVLNIGSLSGTIKSFVVCDEVPYDFNHYHVDGVLGLSPSSKSYLNVSVVPDDLIDQLDKPLISIYVNETKYGNGTGQVTLGAEDTDNCQSTWSYVPALNYFRNSTPYTVHASSAEVTIGGQLTTVNLDTNVTFTHFSGPFEVPRSLKDMFLNGTGATYNASIDQYTIDCDTTKAPLITLNIGGVRNSTDSTSRKLVLSGADYIRCWKRMNVCYLGISFYGSGRWFFGSQVLNNHCISFNYKERTVGFADSKTPKTDVTKA